MAGRVFVDISKDKFCRGPHSSALCPRALSEAVTLQQKNQRAKGFLATFPTTLHAWATVAEHKHPFSPLPQWPGDTRDQGGLVPCPPKDAGFKPRVGSLTPPRAISMAPCLFSGRDPARLASPSSGRRSAGHPGLLFIGSRHLWRCGGMPWLLGIVLGHPLVGLPCPLPIFAAASPELRNGPAASSLAGLPGNECRAQNLYRCLGGKCSGSKQARCTLSRSLACLAHALQGGRV